MSKSHYIIPIFVPHEGCPHDCVFCNQDSITGQEKPVDAAYVRETIEAYLKTILKENSVIEVSFFGGTFTAISLEKQKELLAVAREYKEKGLINFIHLSTRPDYIDEPILENLKDYSVDVIELGIQSMDEEVLLKSGRGHTALEAADASRLIKQYGFTLGHQIMLGLPGDNFKKDISTAEQAIKLRPDICRIYPALTIKDTEMERLFREGKYIPYTLKEAVEISKIIYGMLVSEGINVIRIGLQPTEEINEGGDIVAGPFHPAFRELVEGSLFCDMLRESLAGKDTNNIMIRINDKDMSKLYANRKEFFNGMKEQLNIKRIKVTADNDLIRGELVLETTGISVKLALKDYMFEKYNILKIARGEIEL
jgi:histone acetyltransferase (RNA polymerase elongator complex component)